MQVRKGGKEKTAEGGKSRFSMPRRAATRPLQQPVPRVLWLEGSSRFKSCDRRVFPRPLTRYNDGVLFRIRQLEKDDFDTLWQIDQECFDPQLAYSRAEMAFYMSRPGAFTLVAEAEGGKGQGFDILGFIVAESRRKTGHIITIDVVRKARRAGVGSALLEAAEQQLLRAGAVAVALETPVNNVAAIRFYKQTGYFVEKTVAGYYSGHIDALVMTKELARPVA
jgi:ribosomal-protein-alanine N-acetyltransferase